MIIHPHLSLDIRILDFLDQQKQLGKPEVKFEILLEKYSEAQYNIPGNKIDLDHDGTILPLTLERLNTHQLIKSPVTGSYIITDLGEQKLEGIRII